MGRPRPEVDDDAAALGGGFPPGRAAGSGIWRAEGRHRLRRSARVAGLNNSNRGDGEGAEVSEPWMFHPLDSWRVEAAKGGLTPGLAIFLH